MSDCGCNKNFKAPIPPSVLEIINQCDPVLFHKVVRNANLGDDTAENGTPADQLNYKNVLLTYEANNHSYLYSSDGVPTFISLGELDVDEIMKQLALHTTQITELQETDTELTNELATTNSNVATNAGAIQQTKDELDGLSTVVSNIDTELATAQNDIDNLQTSTEANSIAIATINTNLGQEVEQSTDFTTDTSTVTVEHTKVNLADNTTSNTTDPLPVASETQAGVMNTATYKAIQDNAENVDVILNGAVALNGISVTPTQEELTTAWETATGKTTIVNRASIYDIDNEKTWYYYDNISEWKPLATNTGGEIELSVFTNNTAGIIKGSETEGQVFAEADGTGSVNGWDTLSSDVNNIKENLATNPIPGILTAYTTTDTAGKVYSANYINGRLNGASTALGERTSVTSGHQGIAIGKYAQVDYGSGGVGGIAIGTGSLQDHTRATSYLASEGIAIGYATRSVGSVAIGYAVNTNTSGQTAVGNSAKCTGRGGVALGSAATLNGDYGVALGASSSVSTDAQYGVGLGYYSTATRPYSVSIGHPNGIGNDKEHTTRLLTNVTAGEEDTDAVNLKQMKDYVASTPSPIFSAAPTVNAETGALSVTPTNGATSPISGDTVLLQFGTTMGSIALPYAITSGLQLEYTGGAASPIKVPNVTSPRVSDYTNLTVVQPNSRYLLIFDGEQWIVLMPQAINSTITDTEFSTEWDNA